MGDLARKNPERKQPDPTQVRRVADALQKLADQQQAPPPPPQPPGPQTIIYVQQPAPNPQQPIPQNPPAPQPTPEVHYHTTVQQSPRGRGGGSRDTKSTNALGVASLALGIVACVMAWLPLLGTLAEPIGALGAAFGGVGFVLAILLGRSGAALPFAGIFVCLTGVGISLHQRGQLVPMVDDYRARLGVPAPATQPTGKVEVENPSQPAAKESGGSILDWVSPAPTKSAPPPPDDPAQRLRHAQADVNAARAKVESSKSALLERLAQDPAYRSAKSATDHAEARVKNLRASQGRGADLIEASQDWMAARNKLQKIIHDATLNDTELDEAQKQLAEQESALRALKNQPEKD